MTNREMEQHPIPQNVSQYQFRLIGDMTIKQFLMLGGGIVLGLLMSKAPLIPNFMRWPLAGILAGGGAALAFLPFEERSLDVWLINFIKSIFQPTFFLWQKSAALPEYFTFTRTTNTTPMPQTSHNDSQRLSAYLQSLKAPTRNKMDDLENTALAKISTLMASNPQPSPFQPQTSPQTVTPVNQPVENYSPIQSFPSQTNVAKINPMPQFSTNPPQPINTSVSSAPVNPPPLQAAPVMATAPINPPLPKTDILNQSFLRQVPPMVSPQMAQNVGAQPAVGPTMPPPNSNQVIFAQAPATQPVIPQQPNPTPTYHVEPAPPLTPPMAIKSLYPAKVAVKKPTGPQYLSEIQMPISPDVPNVIIGMSLTKDERLLSNVILEIRDSDNLPIRAIKSNQLGQFFIATPLKNGNYALYAEHYDYTFDPIQIQARGEVLAPIKVISKEPYREEI